MTARQGTKRRGPANSYDTIHLAFTGTSMAPVLEQDDLLEVLPYGRRPIRPGDVIFFVSEAEGGAVVHRVRSVSAAGIRTGGDNCTDDDQTRVENENVVGRVVAALRGKQRRRIAGGSVGLVVASLCRVRRLLLRTVRPLARLPGRWLASAGTGLPASLQPRLIRFASPSGEHWRLLVGRHVVATYRPHACAWQVRLPYRLLLDPATLPIPGTARVEKRP
jgi:signal peptidase I